MAKLYPPYIDGTLPAFALTQGGKGVLMIPFVYNRATSKNDISDVRIKIKTVQNDKELFQPKAGIGSNRVNFGVKDGVGYWDITSFILDGASNTNDKFIIGQYYKIQLAFTDKEGVEGYWSTVGVAKCTSLPTVKIDDLDETKVNSPKGEFVGIFTQPKGGDVTEKVYSSRFVIKDENGNEIYNSDEISHYAGSDINSYSSKDTLKFFKELSDNLTYTIQYIVTTTNNLTIASPIYFLQKQNSLQSEFKGDLIATYNTDKGSILVEMRADKATDLLDGKFIVTRTDSTHPDDWVEVNRFGISHGSANRIIFEDFTVEQGREYQYALQQYNNYSIYSQKKLSNKVQVDFDDIFLYDGERQLRLEFNPQVSSFKTQLAENRSETIGNKYPYFYRNAVIGYKTFPISALVSMFMDDTKDFIKDHASIGREDFSAVRDSVSNKTDNKVYKQTDLLKENFLSERLFKLEVLDWLNDGKVKLFRSPSEGNYLVRLSDVSLSPNTTVGRMLHTVNFTAFECAETSYENFIKYNIIKEYYDDEINIDLIFYGATQVSNENIVAKNSEGAIYPNNLIKLKGVNTYITSIDITDFPPGTIVRFVFSNDALYNSKNVLDIMIGATGNYYADNLDPIYGVYIVNAVDNISEQFNGLINYSYRTPNELSIFNSITKIESEVGKSFNLVGKNDNIISSFSNGKTDFSKLCTSVFFKRPVEYLYYSDEDYIRAGENIFKSFDDWTVKRNSYKERREIKENISLFWINPFLEKISFSDEKSMRYSPYCLYVLKKFNAEKNIPSFMENTEITNYKENYISRILSNLNPEDDIYINGTLVLDAWTGDIYEVDANGWNYDSRIKITKNNAASYINLDKIGREYMDNIVPNDKLDISMGTGVYGYGLYQSVIKNYNFENTNYNLIIDKEENYNDGYDKVNLYKKIIEDGRYYCGYAEYDAVRDQADNYYFELVEEAIENLNKRV